MNVYGQELHRIQWFSTLELPANFDINTVVNDFEDAKIQLFADQDKYVMAIIRKMVCKKTREQVLRSQNKYKSSPLEEFFHG